VPVGWGIGPPRPQRLLSGSSGHVSREAMAAEATCRDLLTLAACSQLLEAMGEGARQAAVPMSAWPAPTGVSFVTSPDLVGHLVRSRGAACVHTSNERSAVIRQNALHGWHLGGFGDAFYVRLYADCEV
jgi:hypothetical protein